MRKHRFAPHRISVPVELVFDFELRKPQEPKELVILLHGFSESGHRMFTKLEGLLPKDSVVLAPNGPFPMATHAGDHYKIGYSWYFYDPLTDEYLIEMETALNFVVGAVGQLGFDHLPVRIIGFSQGGYLAPFLGQRLNHTRQVIGVGCQFLDEELSDKISFRMDGVHGADDSIVDPEKARVSHAKLVSRGIVGKFRLLQGAQHRIGDAESDPMRLAIQEALLDV
jgi:predicted esterase